MSELIQYVQVDASVNSIIGEGTVLRGDFDLNGLLRIDGKFFGKVKTNGKVLVGKNGTAECLIVAGTVVVGGKVRGEILATERITLLSTGEMIGSIKTPRLVIEEGVIFDGTCEVIEDPEKLQRVKNEFIEEHFTYSAQEQEKEPLPKGTERQGKRDSLEQPLHIPEKYSFPKAEKTKVT